MSRACITNIDSLDLYRVATLRSVPTRIDGMLVVNATANGESLNDLVTHGSCDDGACPLLTIYGVVKNMRTRYKRTPDATARTNGSSCLGGVLPSKKIVVNLVSDCESWIQGRLLFSLLEGAVTEMNLEETKGLTCMVAGEAYRRNLHLLSAIGQSRMTEPDRMR